MSRNYSENDTKGFYGPDGEFYPEGSQAAQSMRERRTEVYDREELYPKRPGINYTTSPYPGTEPPAKKEDGLPEGYAGPVMYCKYCGGKIPTQAFVCVHCGCQVGTAQTPPPAPAPVIINNNVSNNNNNVSNNNNTPVYHPVKERHMKSKWLALLLCLFGGFIGLHKFYEGKFLMGLLYLFTGGLAGIGVVIDLIVLLFKPNPYSP